MSHGFRAATLLGFPQFCSLATSSFFFDTAAAPVKRCQHHGKSLLRRTSRKVALSAPADATSERARRGGDSQFYLTASRAELAGAVSGTEGAEVETFFQKLHS